jgi:protein O-mannosyl-transferase
MNSIKENKLQEVFLRDWHPFAWIALVIFLVYSVTLFSGIVFLDDNVLVTGQYQFNKNLANIPQAFNEDIFRTPGSGGTFYRPIERLTFMLDAQFGEGTIVFMSHLTNLLLHILAICLLFKFLLKVNLKKETAFLFSLIAGIHPLTAQTVAFISGRNDSLLAIFIFPALIFFLDFLQTQKRKYLVWHMIFLMLALLTKETAVVLPVICAAYILFFTDWKSEIRNYGYRNYLSLSASWIGIAIIWFLIRRSVLHNFIGNADYNIWLSIYHNLPSLIPSVGKILLPFGLAVFPIMKDMSFIYGIISLILLIAWFLLSEKKKIKLVAFGFLWFLVFILPTLIQPVYMMPSFSENRIYLPMFGFVFVILGLGKIKFPEKISANWRRKIILGVALIVILFFSSITVYRNRYYKDKFSFWKNAVQTSPNFAFNHNNLGAMYYLDGNLSPAEDEFNKALELNPQEKMAHNNLGLVYASENKLSEAENEYKKELEINPYYNNAFYNLGLLYYSENKFEEAAVQWKKILEIDPNFSDALYALAKLYYNQKEYGKATTYAIELSRRGFPLQNEFLQLIHQPINPAMLPATTNK